MIDLMKVYQYLPVPFRSLAVSARGIQLRWLRYGQETEELVSEALERDNWNLDQWKTWQEEHLSQLLHRAATRVPYYRERWGEMRRQGNHSSIEYLENWPILMKNAVRANPLAFVADDCNSKKMVVDHTSGTTGTPLQVYLSRKTIRSWYALFEARARRWNSVSYHEKWAILGGQLVVPFSQEKPPFWVLNKALNQLYLSTHHISANTAPNYIQELNRFKPSHMIVYPSSASLLARLMESEKPEEGSLRVIISNAEYLTNAARKNIERYFGCPVRNTYGMAELAVMATECNNGHLHLWPEAGYVEIMADQGIEPVTPGGIGRIISTGLLNIDMPLIRYETGDRGSIDPNNLDCDKKLPILRSLNGRCNDLVITKDGRSVFWLNPVLYDLPVAEAQIIQKSPDEIRVKVVPAAGFITENTYEIVSRMKQRLGNEVNVIVETVQEIPRTKAGKFQAVLSELKNQ
jgi:phenylacetate-CoA ligase